MGGVSGTVRRSVGRGRVSREGMEGEAVPGGRGCVVGVMGL